MELMTWCQLTTKTTPYIVLWEGIHNNIQTITVSMHLSLNSDYTNMVFNIININCLAPFLIYKPRDNVTNAQC